MDDCIPWPGVKNRDGYGVIAINRRRIMAHRFIYELFRAPIPEGLSLDHLCRVRDCVNPDHLEPVTFTENVMRGYGVGAMNARKTHCIYGHPLDGCNLYMDGNRRRCRECANRRARESHHRRKARRLAEKVA